MPAICRSCGFRCAPGARYCGGCGVPVAEPVPLPDDRSQQRPRTGGWGELKQATVLFADIVSSTEHIADLDPEAAMERLQPAVVAMCDAVEKYGGTVLRTLGDGVMALFGVPLAMEQHAVLACEAALHMQAGFAGGGNDLSIKIGIHSGQVASDPLAQDASKGGGAHGMTIHLASRVVTVARPRGIVVTGECHRLVARLFDFGPRDSQHLKGIARPVDLFELKGIRRGESPHSFRETTLTPFTGRAREMLALQAAQRRTRIGEAGLVGVSGPAGTGKSRLCYEFAQWCRAEGIPVYEVRAQVYGSKTPLRTVLELLRVFFFEIDEADDAALARARIRRRLVGLAQGSDSDLGIVCDFLGVGLPGQAAVASPGVRRSRLLAILSELMRDPGRACCVLLIEDLHLLDQASEEFVTALARASIGTRTMLLVNYRSFYDLPLRELDHFEHIGLSDLDRTEANALVLGLISHRLEFHAISELIASRSGGNPFFAEELVRSLAGGGALAMNGASASADAVQRTLPATVQAVISARIDRLAAHEKDLLQICAIIGKEIPVAVLERVAGPDDRIAAVLGKLCEVEFLTDDPHSHDGTFDFRHPLIQEVAYAAQLKSRRSQIHALVASAMESAYPGRVDELAGLIAHHHEAAGQFCEAAGFLARAARWVGTTDPAEAIRHWHKARLLLRDLPPELARDRLLATAGAQITLLGWRQGLDLSDVQPFIEEAMMLADRVDKRLTQLLLMVEGRMLQASGKPCDWYVERVLKAISLVDPALGAGRAAMLHAALCQAYGWSGRLQEGLAANDVALAGVPSIDAADREFIGFDIEQWVLGMRSRLLARMGRWDEARRCLDEMLVEGEAGGDPIVLQIVHHAYVDLAKCSCDPALAAEHADLVSALGQRHSIPYLHAAMSNCRGMAKSVAQDHAGAARDFAEALALVRSANVAREHETEILANLAECQRELSEPQQALAYAEETIQLSRQRTTRLTECRALITSAAAMLDLDPVGRAGQAGEALAAAQCLIELTGARIYQDDLTRVRDRLEQCLPQPRSVAVVSAGGARQAV